MTDHSRPLVTVVIPAHNAEQFIEDALTSVFRQTYHPIQCIVVDDGSTDKTGARVSEFPLAHYIVQANTGVASARNAGARVGKGSYVAFLDADDVWDERKIEAQMQVMLEKPEVGLVYCGLQMVDEALRPIRVYECAPLRDAVHNLLLLQHPYLFGTTVLVSRSAFQAVGGYDPRLSTSADADLACRVALRYPIESVGEPLVRYRQHGGQMHRSLRVFERDMRILYGNVFGGGRSSVARVTRRRAYAALHVQLAGGYLSARQRRRAAGHVVAALGQHASGAARSGLALWRQGRNEVALGSW
ncbi:MAG: glycosyltransferase family 2 protein [Actinomycetota bacterium]|nr:glycosyltransferase family 2 protein [Actinomycetota bacterium]